MFEQLIIEAENINDHLIEQFGFDEVQVAFKVKVPSKGEIVYFADITLSDCFQAYNTERVDNGTFCFFALSFSELQNEIENFIEKLRSRELREITYAATQMSKVLENQEAFITAAGLDFVAMLAKERSRLAGLLMKPNDLDGDYIPF